MSSGGILGLSAIGTDVSGFAALGNGGSGIQLTDSGFTIQDNVISGNAIDGINLANSNAVILHNFIGIDAGLTGVAIPNGRAGVRFEPGSSGSLATASGVPGILPNTVAFNGVGVWVVAPQFVQDVIIGPGPIYANHGLGIVVGSAPTILPNDPGGSMLNFPLLTSVVSAGGNTTFEGIYNGLTTANAVVTLQFYASPACSPRPREFDEGMTYLGAASVADRRRPPALQRRPPRHADGRARDGPNHDVRPLPAPGQHRRRVRAVDPELSLLAAAALLDLPDVGSGHRRRRR